MQCGNMNRISLGPVRTYGSWLALVVSSSSGLGWAQGDGDECRKWNDLGSEIGGLGNGIR